MVNTAGETKGSLHRHIYLTFHRRLSEVAYARRSEAHPLSSCQRCQWSRPAWQPCGFSGSSFTAFHSNFTPPKPRAQKKDLDSFFFYLLCTFTAPCSLPKGHGLAHSGMFGKFRSWRKKGVKNIRLKLKKSESIVNILSCLPVLQPQTITFTRFKKYLLSLSK